MSRYFASINPTTIPASTLRHRTHALGAALAVGALIASNAVLNTLYEASGHPVDYATGQTSFSGVQVKGWYAQMQTQGTLDLYWATQLFDFVFIGAVFMVGAMTATYLARVNRSHRASGAALWAAAALAIGSCFDVVENLISFVMLVDPQGFPNWLAIPYSMMAVAKFVFVAGGVILLVWSLIRWGLHEIRTAIASRIGDGPLAV